MATFRFTAGPWNVHEGNETFGPGHRKSIPLEEKMKKYAEIGLAGMQFHDDDAISSAHSAAPTADCIRWDSSAMRQGMPASLR